MRVLLIYLLFLQLSGALSLASQNPHPPWRNYTTDDGLPSPEVHYALETPDGYMWFATDNGLSRFDGYAFKNYGIENGLEDPVVFYLQLDPQGRLWMATLSQKLYYVAGDSILAFVEHNNWIKTWKDSIGITAISDFYIDKNGRKFIELVGGGILEWGDKPEPILHQPTDPYSDRIVLLIDDRWVLSNHIKTNENQKLLKEDFYIKGKYPPFQMIGDSSYLLYGIHFNNLSNTHWVKQFESGSTFLYAKRHLYEISGDQILWSRQVPYELATKMIYEAKDGTIYAGMLHGAGLRHYQNLDAWKSESYHQYLSGKSISHIFVDSKENLWVTTVEDGVFFCPNLQWLIYDQAAGLPINHVASIAIKNEDELFVGLRNGQVFKVDKTTQKLVNLKTPSATKVIYDLIYYPPGDELWVGKTGGPGGHLYRKNKQWSSVSYFKKNGSIDYILGKNLTLRKGSNNIWGGSSSKFGGIDIASKKVIIRSNDIVINKRTMAVWESSDRTLWVGNNDGLFVFKDSLLQVPQPFHVEYTARVNDLAEMADSTLVVATKGQGVLLLKDQSFHQINTSNSLTSNMIENVYVDASNNIWVGTLNGLNKISGFQWNGEESVTIQQYTIYNGLPSNEINKVEVLKDQVWVATTKGLVNFKDSVIIDTFSQKPLLTQVLVNGNDIDKHLTPPFSYDQNNVVFDFLSINYRLKGGVAYRYRLKNAQSDWTETRQRSINYSTLQAGKYIFEIQSQNEHGFWSPSTTFKFTIRPPFWKTSWFIILLSSALLFIIYQIYTYRTRQIRQEAEVVKQMADLERSALRAQMNPHFIFNCLNSIANFINKGDKASANQYLSTFAKLIRAALNHSRTDKISLEDEISLLKNYLKLEQLRFDHRFDFQIVLADNVEPFDIEIPPMMVQPFIENSIIHGLVNKEKQGIIRLSYERQNDFLKVIIEDNGVGIQYSKKHKSTHDTLHKSVGMTITKKRLEMLSGKGTPGKVETEELKDSSGNIRGTSVQVWIPIQE